MEDTPLDAYLAENCSRRHVGIGYEYNTETISFLEYVGFTANDSTICLFTVNIHAVMNWL